MEKAAEHETTVECYARNFKQQIQFSPLKLHDKGSPCLNPLTGTDDLFFKDLAGSVNISSSNRGMFFYLSYSSFLCALYFEKRVWISLLIGLVMDSVL